jgi:hypothetical protein
MTTLTFADELVENKFVSANSYVYGPTGFYGLCFDEASKNYPYIMKSGMFIDTFELKYSSFPYQLRNRVLSTAKLKEIMDSAKMPLIIHVRSKAYLIGKGFLSTYDSKGNYELLFLACVSGSKKHLSMEDVKFFVSKKVYTEEHKAFSSIVKGFVSDHKGDVVTCSEVTDYVGEKISFPLRESLVNMTKYKEALVKATIKEGLNITEDPKPVHASDVFTSPELFEVVKTHSDKISSPDSELPF